MSAFRRLLPWILMLMVACALGALAVVRAPVAAQPETPAQTPTPAHSPADTPASTAIPVFGAAYLVRIDFTTRSSLNRVAAAYDVWEVHYLADQTERGWALVQVDGADEARLWLEGFAPVRVDPAASVSGAIAADGAGFACGGMTIEDFPCYRSLVTTYSDLAALAIAKPGLATWRDIGDTWEKVTPGEGAGEELRVLIVTNEAITTPKFRFFLAGALHARELATAETATRFAEMLVNGYGVDADITWLLDHGEAHILAQANPDGRKRAEAGYCWRKNTHVEATCSISPNGGPGVDLNRNFAFKWDECDFIGCSSGSKCSAVYRGSAPASEPETIAVQNYLTSIFPDVRGDAITDRVALDASGLLISLHSYGRLVLYPWGWTDMRSPNQTQLQMFADKMGYRTGYRACAAGAPGCLYNTDGTIEDWVYGERGTAAFTIEMGTTFFQACTTYEESMAAPLLETLIYAFKTARRPYQAPFGPEASNLQLSTQIVMQGQPVLLSATLDTTRYDDNGGRPGGDVVTPTVVSSATWYLGEPSWAGVVAGGNGMEPVDGALDEAIEQVMATIDTSAIPLGKHLIFVEGGADNEQAGVPSAIFLHVVENIPTAPTPAAQLYFPSIHKGGE